MTRPTADAVLIDVDSLRLGGDYIHYAQSQQLPLGQRLGHAYLALVPEPGSLCILLGVGVLLARQRGSRRGRFTAARH